MDMKSKSDFFVFEVTKGWFIQKPKQFMVTWNDQYSDASIQNLKEREWNFRGCDAFVQEVPLTDDVLDAQAYSQKDVDLYSNGYYDKNLPTGVFVKVEAKVQFTIFE